MNWVLVFGLFSALFIAREALYLFLYYREARKSGFPVLINPLNPSNPVYIVLAAALRPVFKRWMPTWLWDPVKTSIYGWEFTEKADDLHQKFGTVVLVASPARIDVSIADPVMVSEILSRRPDFIQLNISNRIMGAFGPNLITSDGDDWQRQRRLVAPKINERISAVVWDESCKQATAMLDHYFWESSLSENDTAIADMRLVAIDVLSRAAYGQQRPWKQDKKPLILGRNFTYGEAVHITIDQLMVSALVPDWILDLYFMPDSLKAVAEARRQLPGLATKMLDEERERLVSHGESRSNLMSMLIQAAEGFDTTTNSLGFAVVLLAVYPEVQDWLVEEIEFVLSSQTDEMLEYAKVFPRLNRCLALMLEVLRLFPPIVHVARSTAKTQTVSNGSENLLLPVGALVFANAMALHLDPKTWGTDAQKFRPSRWLTSDSTLEKSTLWNPPKGTFIPWSGGARVCPGQKFSQVEFVAVIATILSQCRIEPVLEKGEDPAAARRRLFKIIDEAEPRLALQIKNPRDVKLRWIKR